MGPFHHMQYITDHSNATGQYLSIITVECGFDVRKYKVIAVYIFQNQEQGTDGYGELLRPATLVFWSFAAMFLLCEYGQMVTTRFEKIDELVYQMDWHSFPDEIQRMLPTLINNTQQPIIISGFANVEYTRETFDSVS